jgi:hypothetical protein
MPMAIPDYTILYILSMGFCVRTYLALRIWLWYQLDGVLVDGPQKLTTRASNNLSSFIFFYTSPQ